jgi:hypothetical protein
MSSNGGGGSNLLDMGLMIAAGVAAPELAPALLSSEGTFLGLEGASALAGATGVTGAGLSALAAGATGQDMGRAALIGGAGGALSGYMGGTAAEEAAAKANAGIDPNTMNARATDALRNSNQLVTTQGGMVPMEGGTLGNLTPQQLSQNVANGSMTLDQANIYGQGLTDAYKGAATAPQMPGMFDASAKQMYTSGGINALAAMGGAKPNAAYAPPKYTGGNLSKFRYDPNNYTPDIVTPPNPVYQARYAQGGITQLTQDKNFTSGGMYPGSQIDKTQYASSPQTPMSMQSTMASYDPATNPLTGEPTTHMAKGGIAGLLKGRGDGMSDSIHANIAGKQPARLADGEFVVPADVVSHLGNGSTDAGAKHLYKMMDKVRHARTGSKKQGRQIAAGGYLPA